MHYESFLFVEQRFLSYILYALLPLWKTTWKERLWKCLLSVLKYIPRFCVKDLGKAQKGSVRIVDLHSEIQNGKLKKKKQ